MVRRVARLVRMATSATSAKPRVSSFANDAELRRASPRRTRLHQGTYGFARLRHTKAYVCSLAWPLRLRYASLARLRSLTPPATSAKHGKANVARLRQIC